MYDNEVISTLNDLRHQFASIVCVPDLFFLSASFGIFEDGITAKGNYSQLIPHIHDVNGFNTSSSEGEPIVCNSY